MELRFLGRKDYVQTVERMRQFTLDRDVDTPDEVWLVEHEPVFTQGLAGRAEHVLDAAGIPVVQANRGGQVTFHGPGQVVAYVLVDLRRQGIYVKEFVFRLEHAVLKVLQSVGLTGHRILGAPGIYVRLDDPMGHAALSLPAQPTDLFRGLGKVAALGIKVSRHCTYHGVALNVDMDLRPFERINPCGYVGLRSVDLATLGVCTDWNSAARQLGERLCAQFSLTGLSCEQ